MYQLYMGPEAEKPQLVEDATRAVMGLGTGLGESVLVKEKSGDKRWMAMHTEGGYCDFPPHNPLEFELLQFLQYSGPRLLSLGKSTNRHASPSKGRSVVLLSPRYTSSFQRRGRERWPRWSRKRW